MQQDDDALELDTTDSGYLLADSTRCCAVPSKAPIIVVALRDGALKSAAADLSMKPSEQGALLRISAVLDRTGAVTLSELSSLTGLNRMRLAYTVKGLVAKGYLRARQAGVELGKAS